MRESVLLKLVGATRGQVLGAQAIEFLVMSGGIVLIAFVAGTAAAWGVVAGLGVFAASRRLTVRPSCRTSA